MSIEEYRDRLSPEQFEVTQNKATERPFTGKYWDCKEDGTYKCICCGAPLFSSETKYDSGCGWPSFWDPIDRENIKEEWDLSHGMRRVEVMCHNPPEVLHQLGLPGPGDAKGPALGGVSSPRFRT